MVTRPTGPRYNPPRTPTYNVPGSRYNRPVGPRYGRSYGRSYPVPRPSTVYRPIRTNYNTRYYHRPFGYSPVRYVSYYHVPYRYPYVSSSHWYRTYDWYTYTYRNYPNYIYANWIFWPATGYTNGYWTIDNYPYYVFNGYRYRYSTADYCNYQLVDQYDHRVVQSYWNQYCNYGYDQCSMERDRLNAQMGDYRYFCSETFRDQTYDSAVPTYDDSYYGTDDSCSDADGDGYCDESYDPNYSEDEYYDNDYQN